MFSGEVGQARLRAGRGRRSRPVPLSTRYARVVGERRSAGAGGLPLPRGERVGERGLRRIGSMCRTQQQSHPSPGTSARPPLRGRRQVVLDHLGKQLEHLEVVPRAFDPERHNGLKRRAARHRAVDLRHHDGGILGERKARARPFPHPFGGAVGGLLAAETEAGGLVQMRILTISNMGFFSTRRFPPPGGMF